MGEPTGMPDPGPLQSRRDSGPRGGIRAVPGRLIGHLRHRPPPVRVPHERHLPGAEHRPATGTGNVLTSPRRQSQNALRVDNKGEGLGALQFPEDFTSFDRKPQGARRDGREQISRPTYG